jgi:DNA helicase-2/ATP-dependent DNA helicase PcrA
MFDPAALPELLNPPQLEAATLPEGPLLVLAGAGSGKTRVITFRIANLVVKHRVEPWRILAVTFTNKAAGEMRQRLEGLLGPEGTEAWVSTFHAAGARILRRHADVLGLDPRFVIYDDADQIAEMKRVMKAAGVDPKEVSPRRFLSRVDDAKNQGLTPVMLANKGFRTETDRLAHEMYDRYQKALTAANAVDFGDLLLRLVELFEKSPDVLLRYQRRFKHIMVDEFQDTNPVQYRILRMLAGDGRGLCVVGDDDQAIYRWRGADVKNLLSFPEHFPGTRIVKLEQNYRSSQVILDAAHAVITRNPRRMDKKLWTEQSGGAPLELVVARDERDEAGRIADMVRTSIGRGVVPHEIAVFYRTNAQSRVLEDAFRLGRIPYAVVRGRSFYDRAEVKDLAAYLRLAVNPRSDQDALRVINKPARGIGDTTVGRIEEAARAWGVGVVDACARSAEIPGLNAGARAKVQGFARVIGELALSASEGPAGPVAGKALELSGMQRAFESEGTDDALDRLENVRELVGAAEEFDNEWEPPKDPGDPEAPETPALAAFLEQIALLGEADEKVTGPKVSLMTLHAAKGLEFEEVFLAGMEENVFPHFRALGEDGGPEEVAEERRLCYVGFTRAKRRLVLSLASSRVLFGELHFNNPSRFLGEVPRSAFSGTAAPQVVARAQTGVHVEYDEPARRKDEPEIDLGDDDGFTVDYSYDQRPAPVPVPPMRRRAPERAATLPSAPGLPGAYEPGARVRHAQFGVGVVVAADGDKVSVRFPAVGLKRVVARFVQPA